METALVANLITAVAILFMIIRSRICAFSLCHLCSLWYRSGADKELHINN